MQTLSPVCISCARQSLIYTVLILLNCNWQHILGLSHVTVGTAGSVAVTLWPFPLIQKYFARCRRSVSQYSCGITIFQGELKVFQDIYWNSKISHQGSKLLQPVYWLTGGIPDLSSWIQAGELSGRFKPPPVIHSEFTARIKWDLVY